MRKLILIALALLPLCLSAQKKKCVSDEFTGTERKMAKMTFASAKNVETFADLQSFLKSLPDDKTMTTRQPPITSNPYFMRIPEEDRSVTISEVYVFSVTHQKDNDYQLVIGSDKDLSKAVIFIAEVSGLPESTRESYSTLSAVRAKVKAQFGDVCEKPLLLLDNPVKVAVTGSLFFDIEKKPGSVTLKKAKTKTAWEIHPISEIVFN